jgi:hypothetical protein
MIIRNVAPPFCRPVDVACFGEKNFAAKTLRPLRGASE